MSSYADYTEGYIHGLKASIVLLKAVDKKSGIPIVIETLEELIETRKQKNERTTEL